MTQSYGLFTLEAELYKTLTETSTEQDADGKFIWRDSDGDPYFWSPHPYRYVHHKVDTVADADQVSFLCPACFAKNNGPVGTHHVMVTFANRTVPDEAGSRGKDGKPTRWSVSGNSLRDLVLTPSIQIHGPCNWHGFVGSSGIPPGHAG